METFCKQGTARRQFCPPDDHALPLPDLSAEQSHRLCDSVSCPVPLGSSDGQMAVSRGGFARLRHAWQLWALPRCGALCGLGRHWLRFAHQRLCHYAPAGFHFWCGVSCPPFRHWWHLGAHVPYAEVLEGLKFRFALELGHRSIL